MSALPFAGGEGEGSVQFAKLRGMNTTIDFDRYDRIRPIRWTGQALELLDQRKLPFVVEYVTCSDSAAVADAIHALAVRGAPAIGITAAWGVVLAAKRPSHGWRATLAQLGPALVELNASRPTAVNLPWAMRACVAAARPRAPIGGSALEDEARGDRDEDLAGNRLMGDARRRAARARHRRADPLQHRFARHCRLRHRAGRDSRRRRRKAT